MNNFYVLKPEEGTRFGRKWAYGDVVDPANYIDSGERCPVCGDYVSSKRWAKPHRIKLSSAIPEKWGDFVWGAGFSLLISRRFKQIYENERLTGFNEISPPVEIVSMGKLKSHDHRETPPKYHHVDVPWGGANQDDLASELIHEMPEKIKCNYCRVGVSWRKQARIVIEDDTWNGTDIFKPRNTPTQFVVSDQFREIAEKYELKNLWLIPTEKFGYDERRSGLWYVHE
jgi:hypothetical protein